MQHYILWIEIKLHEDARVSSEEAGTRQCISTPQSAVEKKLERKESTAAPLPSKPRALQMQREQSSDKAAPDGRTDAGYAARGQTKVHFLLLLSPSSSPYSSSSFLPSSLYEGRETKISLHPSREGESGDKRLPGWLGPRRTGKSFGPAREISRGGVRRRREVARKPISLTKSQSKEEEVVGEDLRSCKAGRGAHKLIPGWDCWSQRMLMLFPKLLPFVYKWVGTRALRAKFM